MNNRRSPASKPKDFKKAIINLFGYCKDYYRLIIFAIVLSIISSIFSIIGPGKVRDIINEITIGLTSTINMEVIKDITLFLAVLAVGPVCLNGDVAGLVRIGNPLAVEPLNHALERVDLQVTPAGFKAL